MSDMMTFPATVEEFMEQYKIVDDEKVYTNGAALVPIFRMMQWFEHVSATDTISRQAAIDVLDAYQVKIENGEENPYAWARLRMSELPSAQPEQRYTEEELRVFQHGISLSLLSKRSAQYWRYDADTAIEIEFLERLYEKVGADMRGEQDG
jgi:hypothetical protein